MKVFKVVGKEEESTYPMDTIRSTHLIDMNSVKEKQPHHADKWLLVVELRPIKIMDPSGTGQVIDHCQQKEWLFNTRAEADVAVQVADV